MLGARPKDVSQSTTSQGYFPKRQLPKGIFPSGIFQPVQFPTQKVPKSVKAAVLGPLACSIHSARPLQTILAVALGPRFRRPNLPLGSCHLGSRPWKNTSSFHIVGIVRNPTVPRGLVTVVHLRPRLTSTLEASLSLGVVMSLEARTTNSSMISPADQPLFRSALQQYFTCQVLVFFKHVLGVFHKFKNFPKTFFQSEILQFSPDTFTNHKCTVYS